MFFFIVFRLLLLLLLAGVIHTGNCSTKFNEAAGSRKTQYYEYSPWDMTPYWLVVFSDVNEEIAAAIFTTILVRLKLFFLDYYDRDVSKLLQKSVTNYQSTRRHPTTLSSPKTSNRILCCLTRRKHKGCCSKCMTHKLEPSIFIPGCKGSIFQHSVVLKYGQVSVTLSWNFIGSIWKCCCTSSSLLTPFQPSGNKIRVIWWNSIPDNLRPISRVACTRQ